MWIGRGSRSPSIQALQEPSSSLKMLRMETEPVLSLLEGQLLPKYLPLPRISLLCRTIKRGIRPLRVVQLIPCRTTKRGLRPLIVVKLIPLHWPIKRGLFPLIVLKLIPSLWSTKRGLRPLRVVQLTPSRITKRVLRPLIVVKLIPSLWTTNPRMPHLRRYIHLR